MAAVICPYCNRPAQFVGGAHIYPRRPDLFGLKFWRCDPCDAHVGVHRRNRKLGLIGDEPLGRLANAELRRARNLAHAAFDPLWRSGQMERRAAYAWLAGALGISVANCHIAMFDVDGCAAVVAAVNARSEVNA